MGACTPAFEDAPSYGRFSRSKIDVADYRVPETDEDILLDLASRMAPDGGMPGKCCESRAIVAERTLQPSA
jgi:hypothetical protein